MTLPTVVVRNQVQKTNKRTFALVNDVVQPTTWYTCPTGKIAIVKGSCTCVDTGAAATSTLAFGGVVHATWLATGGSNVLLDDLAEQFVLEWTAFLEAGDTIVTDQNTGTNSQFKLQMEVEEFNI